MVTAVRESEKSQSALTIKVIRGLPGFLALKDNWDGLLSQSRNDSIFLTWEWMYNWWLVYKENGELFIITAEDNEGNLAGIAPLAYIEKPFLLGTLRVFEFLGTGEKKKDKTCSEFLDIIARRGMEEEVTRLIFDYLLAGAPGWDILNLESLLDTSNILRYISTNKDENLILRKAPNSAGGYNYFTLQQFREEISDARERRFSKSLKNLARHGKVSVRACDSEASLDEDMRAFIRLHQLRWACAGRPGCFSSGKFTQFHQGLARSILKKGWLVLQLLEVNDKPVACEYCFAYNRRLFIYQSGFNPRLDKNISLGHLSMAYVIKGAFTKGIEEVDLLRGEEPYKKKWSKDKRLVFDITAARKSLKVFAYIALKTAMEKSKSIIKAIMRKITGAK